ncbi:MAG: hypothetical protein KBS74_00890 [Clostridiales bacterium]|nr:hypothetical protein [Candidatus Cacconaster stercorequi]
MQILIRRDNFSADCYELQIGDAALAFAGKNDSFTLPYSAVKDFSITQDRRGKAYFTTLSSGRMLEGQILEPKEIDSFTAALKERLDGVINIEVRR